MAPDGTVGFADVHAHFVTASSIRQAQTAGHTASDGVPALSSWSAAAHLEVMDRCGIDTAMLSVSSPGVHFGGDATARRLAREVNEAGADGVVLETHAHDPLPRQPEAGAGLGGARLAPVVERLAEAAAGGAVRGLPGPGGAQGRFRPLRRAGGHRDTVAITSAP